MKMMRTLLTATLLFPFVAAAQYRPLETVDEARQRHNAQRYEQHQQRGYEAPLGGYRDRFGDPAPRGTESPGYVAPSDRFGPQPDDLRKRRF